MSHSNSSMSQGCYWDQILCVWKHSGSMTVFTEVIVITNKELYLFLRWQIKDSSGECLKRAVSYPRNWINFTSMSWNPLSLSWIWSVSIIPLAPHTHAAILGLTPFILEYDSSQHCLFRVYVSISLVSSKIHTMNPCLAL